VKVAMFIKYSNYKFCKVFYQYQKLLTFLNKYSNKVKAILNLTSR